MFVNQVLFRHKNVASDYFLLFGMLEYCSLHFNRNKQNCSYTGSEVPLTLFKPGVFAFYDRGG